MAASPTPTLNMRLSKRLVDALLGRRISSPGVSSRVEDGVKSAARGDTDNAGNGVGERAREMEVSRRVMEEEEAAGERLRKMMRETSLKESVRSMNHERSRAHIGACVHIHVWRRAWLHLSVWSAPEREREREADVDLNNNKHICDSLVFGSI